MPPLGQVKTHCKNGHPRTGENLIGTQGATRCKQCRRAYEADYNGQRDARQASQKKEPADPSLRAEDRDLRALQTIELRFNRPYETWRRLEQDERVMLHREWNEEMRRLAMLPGAQLPWATKWDARGPKPEPKSPVNDVHTEEEGTVEPTEGDLREAEEWISADLAGYGRSDPRPSRKAA